MLCQQIVRDSGKEFYAKFSENHELSWTLDGKLYMAMEKDYFEALANEARAPPKKVYLVLFFSRPATRAPSAAP